MLEKGDTVFLEYPSYDRSITALKRAGADVVGIPMDNDGVDIDRFKEQLALKCPKIFYTIPDFQNPTGITASLERRKIIADLAVKHGFYIIEDAPYKPLRYYGEDVPGYKELAPENVIFVSSFSKVLSPGIRVGFLIGPKTLMPEIRKWSENTYIHPALVTEGIVYEYCRRGLLEPNVEKLKKLYRPRLDGILKSLETHLTGKALWTRPEGGFFISLFLPDDVDGGALQKGSREFGFSVSSGNGFFTDGKGDKLLRLPFCQMEPAETEEGIKRLAAAVAHFRK
jgi:2-aminoadipate transaminase